MATEKQHATAASPTQVWGERQANNPVPHPRTIRTDRVSVVTSSRGGKLVPLAALPILREDAVGAAAIDINLQMAETASMLLNPVKISVSAYVVPKLAFARFQDMGTIDRSYNGIAEIDGSVVPWFQTKMHDANAPSEIMKTLGLHMPNQHVYNTDYIEAYNVLWNWLARNRSAAITERDESDETLAPAFWSNTQMQHVVPTFDDALIDGEVALRGVEAPIEGIRRSGSETFTGEQAFLDGTPTTYTVGNSGGIHFDMGVDGSLTATVEGASFSLADIDAARKTAAWARMRNRYSGKSEEWMMDQLLSGVRLPQETLRNPVLVGAAETIVGMTQRYATDSGNLEKSLTDGRTRLRVNVASPAIPCGGVLLIVGQALPEQMYERQRDYFLATTTVDALPNRVRDELDPQPVQIVTNKEVECSHALPDDLFGYAPLNHGWQREAPKIGGRYYRTRPDAAWSEDRNRFWTSEVVDPQLGPDFYLSTELSHEVFEYADEDPFEWWLSGAVPVSGLTYFGPTLRESNDDYDAVMAQVPQERLKGDGTD